MGNGRSRATWQHAGLALTCSTSDTFCFSLTAKAISLDPTFAKAYYRRASAHLSILDPKAALPDLRKVSQLEPRNATVRAQLDATTKLLRRIQFEKAIAKSEGPKSWQTAVEHLRDGTGGTLVKEDYDGPRIDEGEPAKEGADPHTTEPYLGAITEVSRCES